MPADFLKRILYVQLVPADRLHLCISKERRGFNILSALACLFHMPQILAPGISEVNVARYGVLLYPA